MDLRIIKVLSLLLIFIGCSKQSPQELLEESKIMITNQNYSEKTYVILLIIILNQQRLLKDNI